jgi:hypothetical protein
MTPLLLFGGLAAARQSVGAIIQRAARNILAYAALVFAGVAALGFLTAAGFLYFTSIWGAVTASLTMAAVYASLGTVLYVAIAAPRTVYPSAPVRPASFSTPPDGTTAAAKQTMSGGLIAAGLLAAAGYVAGRSIMRRP